MSELKPCPFCGSNNAKKSVVYGETSCQDCGAKSIVGNWNTRPLEDAKDAEISRLKEWDKKYGVIFNAMAKERDDAVVANAMLEAKLSKLNAEILRLNNLFNQVNDQQHERDEEISRLKSELTRYTCVMGDIQAKYDLAQEEIARLNKAVEELEGSTVSIIYHNTEVKRFKKELDKYRWIPENWDAVSVANFWMQVKKTDYCWEWEGYKNTDGYGVIHEGSAHRIVYQMFYGDTPDGLEVMHSCNNPACVNPSHLSAGTHTENMQTMFKLRRYSRCGKSSKYIGVSYRNDSNKWRAILNHKSLGCYSTEEDAAHVYDKAAIEHYGKDAATNFPLPQPPEDENG